MTDDALPFEPIRSLAALIRVGELSPTALTERLLERIASLDARLHAYVRVTRERALAEARSAEIALGGGRDLGPLQGIPYAVKDLFDVKGVPTTAGTHLLEGNVAREDCAAVHRLSAAGMALLGKNHTIQLAYGVVGINSDQGTPHNPWHQVPHAPGGSSSGSAVAVAAGLAPASLGTDTGGSVRIPASLCGVVGLKTTVGRVSRRGVHPLSGTLDSVGVLARSVEDAALVYDSLHGADRGDSTTAGVAPQEALRGIKDGVRGVRLAFGETLFFDAADAAVEKAVRASGEVLRSLGARVDRMEVPEVAALWAEQKRALFIAAEGCASNRDLLDAHFDALDPLVAPRMIAGRTLTAPEYYALTRRFAALREQVLWTLRDVDALLLPTTSETTRPIESIRVSREAYVDYNLKVSRNSGLGNMLNFCGISVPCGFTPDGFPVGLMIYAKPFQEDLLLRIAHAYEQATDWHRVHPSLAWAQSPAGIPSA
jgi:aspartyl-tRNA(Asn)/glutamyl-tRNA(Gln) amidotransferase subunit A